MSIGKVRLLNSRFRLKQPAEGSNPKGIDFNNLNLSHLNLKAQNFTINGDTITTSIYTLSFTDHSGFTLSNLRANMLLCNTALRFNKLRVIAHGSYIRMRTATLLFNKWKDFGHFTRRIRLIADFDNARVTTRMLGFFAPELNRYDIEAKLNGKITGRINSLRGKALNIAFGETGQIVTSFNIEGLPKLSQTLLDINFRNLSFTRNDLLSLRSNTNRAPLIELPGKFDQMQTISFKGSFTGYPNDFVAYGAFSSAIGKVKVDMAIAPDKKNNININGRVSARELDIGRLLSSNKLGKASFAAKVKGTVDSNNKPDLKTDALIFSFLANSYNYQNISISGNLTDKTYVGSVKLDDPNCKINFLGKIDFSDSIPEFNFSAFIPNINLAELNLNPHDSISRVALLLTTNFKGSNLDNSKGEIKVTNLKYRNQRGRFTINEIRINADNTGQSRVITLQSDVAEGELRSRYRFSRFYSQLRGILAQYIPSLNQPNSPAEQLSDSATGFGNDYLIKFRLKNLEVPLKILLPDLFIAKHTSFFGILNPNNQSLNFKLRIPRFRYRETFIKDLIIDGTTRDSVLQSGITTPLIRQGNAAIRNFKVSSVLRDNRLALSIGWDNPDKPITRGKLKSTIDFSHYSDSIHTTTVRFAPSTFVINDSTWQVSPALIAVDTASIRFNNFRISSRNQQLMLEGTLSTYPTDSLYLELKNFNLAYLNIYLQNMGYRIQGTANGSIRIRHAYQNPNLLSNIRIKGFTANSSEIGNITFTSRWIGSEKRMAVKLTNYHRDTLTFAVGGDIYPESKTLLLKANLYRVWLKHLAPLLEGNISGLAGSLSGSLNLTGTFQHPNLNGTIHFNRARATVEFLKTRYRFDNAITLKNSDILFNRFVLTDKFGHKANVNGAIRTDHFNSFNLNLTLSTDNFLCMNTTEYDNETFYGTVFGTGVSFITGPPDNLNLSINLKTENKTAIYLPLPTGSDVEQNHFISFVSNDPEQIVIEEEASPSTSPSTNLTLNLNLQVTPEAEAQIIIDKKLGDIIRANGSGNLRMVVNPYTDLFKMFGTYTIEKGDYLFTLQGVINKKFRIEQGSSISWGGDPLDATMDIRAIYRVKTSLKQLLLDERYNTRVPVDCKILLTQKLMAPNIKFKIEVPNADSQTKALVEGALNTEEKVNTQFLGLLLINSFIADQSQTAQLDESSSSSSMGTVGLYNTASELLSNQLSNWISQWSNTFDIGINYRPGMEQDLSSDQMEFALSTQVLNDRVSINGNVDVGRKSTNAPIAGDFNIDVKLNKSGKLRLKAFARSNNDILPTNEQNNYTTGAGIVYREDFNNFRDLLFRIKNIFKSDYQITPVEVPEVELDDSTGKEQEKSDSTFIIIR